VTKRTVATATAGELVGVPGSFLEPALAFAQEARRENTRRACKAAYRAFAAFATVRLGGGPVDADDVDRDLVVAYRDHLSAAGAAPSTISARLSALRSLAAALDLDPRIARVKTATGEQPTVPALTEKECDKLLEMPDRRTTAGKRDRALLHVLGDAGLRRSEAVRLDVDDFIETRRARDPRRRKAVAGRPAQETSFELVVRDAKGGTSRTVPLTRRAHEALHDWWDARPPSADTTLFVSLESNRAPHALSPAAVAGIVAKHAERARLPDGLRAPHVLRHTFCTLLAEHDVAIDVIRDLAGHASIRTTQKYIHVTDQRRGQAIARLETRKHPLDQPLEPAA
jgi:integrase/recombinase XerD